MLEMSVIHASVVFPGVKVLEEDPLTLATSVVDTLNAWLNLKKVGSVFRGDNDVAKDSRNKRTAISTVTA